MKNKVLLTFIIIVSLAGGLIYASTVTEDVQIENALEVGISSTGADIVEATISCWGKLNDEFITSDRITIIMDDIISKLNPETESIYRLSESEKDINKEILYGSLGNKSYVVAVESIESENSSETYIIIDTIVEGSCNELIAEKEKVHSIFEEKGILIKFNSCVKGIFDGKLSEEQIEEKIELALDSVSAKTIEGIKTDEMSSISAFSNSIENNIISNNKKVNMQVAMRYSSYDDKTYILIGSPLIHIEY